MVRFRKFVGSFEVFVLFRSVFCLLIVHAIINIRLTRSVSIAGACVGG